MMIRDTRTNITLYPWFKAFQSLTFWQAIWFLYFQDKLSAADAILLYAVYDIGTTVLEVPSGYLSDRIGRRITLILALLAAAVGAALLALGDSFLTFAVGQLLLGAGSAFASGTDSALLFESLVAEGRDEEVEQHEIRAWRFGFVALAFSAITGGLVAQQNMTVAFLLTAAASSIAVVIATRFSEPPHKSARQAGLLDRRLFASLMQAYSKPVLIWLFCLSLLMYVFSHIPFVFGQPIILQALTTIGFDGQTPSISGAVTATMMLISVLVSLAAPAIRQRLGLAAMLLAAFAMQIGLIGLLALTAHPLIILALFWRMVPDSLSKPFITARVQPELSQESRATFLSLQSFCGRLIFALSLFVAAQGASTTGEMAVKELSIVLISYMSAGGVALLILAVTVRLTALNSPPRSGRSRD